MAGMTFGLSVLSEHRRQARGSHCTHTHTHTCTFTGRVTYMLPFAILK